MLGTLIILIILNMLGTGQYRKAVADYLTELKIVSGEGKLETYGPETQCRVGFSTKLMIYQLLLKLILGCLVLLLNTLSKLNH